MKVKTHLALIINGERVGAGSVITVDEAVYQNISAYVTVLDAEPVSTPNSKPEPEPEPESDSEPEPESKPKRKKAV